MTSSTFDGSTGGEDAAGVPPSHPFYGLNNVPDDRPGAVATAPAPAAQQQAAPQQPAGEFPPPSGWSDADADPASTHAGAHNGGGSLSTLAQLRERMQHRDSEPIEPFTTEIPDLGLRLVCNPVIEHTDFKRWLKAATGTGKKKRSGQTDATDIDQLVLSAHALTHQNERVEMDMNHGTGRTPNWVALPAPEGGALAIGHQAFWREYNVLSSLALLQKLYRKDPRIITAGQDLLNAAGYGDEEDEDPEA